MSDAGDFIDAALRYEVSPYSYSFELPDGLTRYGTSVGAIRGTIRDVDKKFPGMGHDEVTELASELWANPVFERRAAAIVLLQGKLELLVANDLTRFEGFIRSAGADELVEQLVNEIMLPMLSRISTASQEKARVVFARWTSEPDPVLRRAGERMAESIG